MSSLQQKTVSGVLWSGMAKMAMQFVLFIVMTILSPLLIVGMIAAVVFLTRVNNDQKKVICVLDESPYLANKAATA